MGRGKSAEELGKGVGNDGDDDDYIPLLAHEE